jgi:Na+-transporting NADH:ubiquinone oxidoreductase subunit C
MEFTPARTIGFASIVCFVCAILVASAAVGLKDKQRENELLDRQKKVLDVAGLLEKDTSPDAAQITSTFADRISPQLIPLKEGGCEGEDVANFDQMKASKDPEKSAVAPKNKAKVGRLPYCAMVYLVRNETDKSKTDTIILPIEGKGLWSTLYGFIALHTNGVDIKGLTFYKHGETPGLGGEVDNPKWKAKWEGKKAFKPNSSAPVLSVKKGQASPDDPYSVDGLSGATITSNGVTHLIQFWLGEHCFGPHLKSIAGSES